MTKTEYDALPDDAFVSSEDIVPIILEDIDKIEYPRRDANGKGCSELMFKLLSLPKA